MPAEFRCSVLIGVALPLGAVLWCDNTTSITSETLADSVGTCIPLGDLQKTWWTSSPLGVTAPQKTFGVTPGPIVRILPSIIPVSIPSA